RSGIGHPFIRIDCSRKGRGKGAPAAALLRRIFGYEGPDGEVQTGALETAEDGVLYLHTADEMGRRVASRLSAALKKGRFHREGGSRLLPGKASVIFSTTANLQQTPIEEVLGNDLAAHIEDEPIRVPNLRERWEDIRGLVEHFLSQFCSTRGLRRPVVDEATLEVMEKFHWPENTRGLKSAVERLVVYGTGDVIALSDLPKSIQGIAEEEPAGQPSAQVREKKEWEKEYLSQLLRAHNGNLRKTASQLAISEGRLRTKMKEYGLDAVRRTKGRGTAQRTLGKSVLLSGQGLHSGLKTGLILSPLPPDSGIRIGNITSEESVLAHLDNVVSTDYATTLQEGPITVRTIEHLMSALHAYGISNVLIKVAEEIPIMDGSAKDFCRLIEDAGAVEQEAFIEPVEVASPIEVSREGARGGSVALRIEPHSEFVVDFHLVLPEPIGAQQFTFTLDKPELFRDSIAPARTFGRIKDVEEQEKRGLAGGGRLDNVILLDEGRVINTELRFPDEFVRHKILDVIGDLYLLGRPILGKVTARMSGHRENIKLLRKLQTQ
ncbi:MAG: UDP-3-O-acyl-N-acetylglucosamine deacetylase, partial [bacterium]